MKLNFTLTSPHSLETCRAYFSNLPLYLKAHTKPGTTFTITDADSPLASNGPLHTIYTIIERRTITPAKNNPQNRSVTWSSTHVVTSTTEHIMSDTITAGQGHGTTQKISLEPAALSTPGKPETMITYDLDFAVGNLSKPLLFALRNQLKQLAIDSAALDLAAITALAKELH
jgi:hypothetical protein